MFIKTNKQQTNKQTPSVYYESLYYLENRLSIYIKDYNAFVC